MSINYETGSPFRRLVNRRVPALLHIRNRGAQLHLRADRLLLVQGLAELKPAKWPESAATVFRRSSRLLRRWCWRYFRIMVRSSLGCAIRQRIRRAPSAAA